MRIKQYQFKARFLNSLLLSKSNYATEINTQSFCFCREIQNQNTYFLFSCSPLCFMYVDCILYKYLIIIDIILFQNIQILSTLSFDLFIIILYLYISLHFTTNLKLRVFIISSKIILRFCIANELLRCQQLLFCNRINLHVINAYVYQDIGEFNSLMMRSYNVMFYGANITAYLYVLNLCVYTRRHFSVVYSTYNY